MNTDSPTAADLCRQLAQEQHLSVVEGRERLRAAMPGEALRIAGVTFGGRQELVAALQPGEMLLLLPNASSCMRHPSSYTRCMHAACHMRNHSVASPCMPAPVQCCS